MANSVNDIPETWLSLVGGSDPSGWLRAFIHSPKKAVADLLEDSFYLGPVNLTERGQLIAGWLDVLGNSELFAERLDAQFTSWVEDNWGKYNRRAESLVSTWSCLCSVIEVSSKLPVESQLKQSAVALRSRLPESQQFLGSFSTAPSADPHGLYLAVIAEFQGKDRSLAPFWHYMCDLPDGVPFYHARYAMLGLRRLGAVDPIQNGTLRAEVVLGLLRLARGFERLVRTRGLAGHVAKSVFQRLAVQTADAYPDSPGWVNHGLTEVMELPEPVRKWVIESVPPLAEAIRRENDGKTHRSDRPHRSLKPNPDWPRRVRELVARLRSGDHGFLSEARQLLKEQSLYTDATGDTYYKVRTLCNFARRALRLSPQLALRWAEEARRLEPNNHYTWNTEITVLRNQNRLTEALRLAWVAWKRFPEESVMSNSLAEALKADRRYNEAEAIYREAVERFPDDVIPRNGLAEVLKAIHHYNDAVEIYRQTLEQFPQDTRSRNGLADTLRRMRHTKDAEAEYRRSIKAGYVDPATFVGLAYLVLHQGEAGRVEATELINQALQLDPIDYYALALKRQLTSEAGKNLDDLKNEWDEVADKVFDPLATSTRENVRFVDDVEAKDARNVESPPSATKQTSVPIVSDSKDFTQKEATGDDLKPAMVDRAKLSQSLPAPNVIIRRDSVASDTPQSQPQPFVASDPLTVAALVAEAYFYRTWASDVGNKFAELRRRKTAELLTKAEQLSPHDPGVLTEKIALSIVEGNKAAGYQSLVTQLSSHPASTSLLILKARLDREKAREENRRLNEATLSELCAVPQRLRDLHPVLMPLFHYQRGLAALALLDGNERKEVAANAFSRFRETLANRAAAEHKNHEAPYGDEDRLEPSFYEWLRVQANRRLFAGVGESNDVEVRPDHISLLEANWEQRRPVIEGIEDVFADRLAFRTI